MSQDTRKKNSKSIKLTKTTHFNALAKSIQYFIKLVKDL
jgi:hypothetical protein